MATNNPDSCQLSLDDVSGKTSAGDKSIETDEPKNKNPERNLKFSKNKVSIPKELEELIELFFEGKI